MVAGELLIIGGNEEKCRGGEIISAFINLANRKGGPIGILPAASRIPNEVSKDYRDLFKKMGAPEVVILDVDTREKAEEPAILQKASELSALFITGGDQERLSDLIRETELHALITRRWKEGMPIAGTSAGASIMGKHMIVYAETKVDDDRLFIRMGKGFGFLENLLIDQHFSQRGRFGRLIGAIAENQDLIGIGIDENTAILVRDQQFEVYGEHQVFIIDGKSGELVDQVPCEQGGIESTITNFKLHTLTAGYSFDLSARKIMLGKGE